MSLAPLFPRKTMTDHRLRHSFTALGCVVAIWFTGGPVSQAADAPKPIEVKTARPTRGDVVRYVTLPGTIRANQQVTLYAKVAGYLKSLSVDKGDRVQAGQSLGEIEVPELIVDVARHKAELVRAEAEMKVAEIESGRLVKAQKQAPDLVLPQAVDSAEGRRAVARAGVELARANLERTDTLLRYSRITAPFGGVVTMRFVDPGAFIPSATAGSAAQTAAIVTLADFNTVRVQVALPEIEAALAQVGQPVRFTVDALPGKAFTARISRMSYALDDATKSMLIEADLPNTDLSLRPGMYAITKVGVEKHTDVLAIPVEALVMEKANAFTFIADRGKAKKTALKIGFNDGARIEVLSGLTGGEAVILVGRLALADGAAINAVEAK